MARLDAVGHTCPICGVVFLLKARFDAHREAEIPAFAAKARAMNAAAERAWLARQVETGRVTPAGEWVKDWRP